MPDITGFNIAKIAKKINSNIYYYFYWVVSTYYCYVYTTYKKHYPAHMKTAKDLYLCWNYYVNI